MEACVFTTNSLTKSIEFSSKILTHSKKNSPQSHHGKLNFKSPSSISCSLRDEPQPSDEDKSPVIKRDWRSFRARLVSGERSSSTAELGPSQYKWAHAINEPEKGCLLIATEKLDGVHIFERAVVLILSNGPVGPKGIILNRPSLMSIKEASAGAFTDRPLFFGGPLKDGIFLLAPKRPEAWGDVDGSGVFEELMEGMYYGTRQSVGCASEMVKRGVVRVQDFRFFDGYCGWEREQLRGEINAGYWTVAACSPTAIELGNVGSIGLWDQLLELVGPRRVW